MLLAQSGIMGVFTAQDALLFYFFWELALIPVYFLSSKWGDERRIQATFKFFVYTFAGSLLMLVGIIYVYLHTAPRTFSDGTYAAHSFLLSSFYNASLSGAEQTWLFWLFFVGFAIKMPVFLFIPGSQMFMIRHLRRLPWYSAASWLKWACTAY